MQNQPELQPAPEPEINGDIEPDPSLLEPVTATVSGAIDAAAQSLSCSVVDLVSDLGLPNWVSAIVWAIIVFLSLALLAFLIFFVVRPVVLKLFTGAIRRSSTKWDDALIKYGIAKWTSHFVSALFINLILPGFANHTIGLGGSLKKAGLLYLVISGLLVINSILNASRTIFIRTKDSHKLPATSLIQVLKLIAFMVALILAVSTIAGKSPLAFLGGLGIFTSVIMLVFKDAILGFAAGIQLTSNDMIREGDWIEMPKHGADGTVQEVGLTTVKVMNFDKTITTLPTYSLISESFKNWRSMPKSGGRRIKRSLSIDLKTIRLCNDEMLNRYRKIEYISGYLDKKLKEIQDWNTSSGLDPSTSSVNGRNLTNIGTFRAYIEAYLRNHPHIHHEGMTLIVRQLASGPEGVPIEVYCFSKITTWAEYELIQSDIFDHIFAVAKEFDLKIFQNPTHLWPTEAQTRNSS